MVLGVKELSPIVRRWLCLPTPLFAIVTGSITLLVQIIVVQILSLFPLDLGPSAIDFNQAVPLIVFLLVFVAPIFETFLAQTIPILVVQFFTSNPIVPIAISTAVFSLIHLGNSLWYPLFVLPGAFIYAFGYFYKQRDHGSGFWPITLSHAVHNSWVAIPLTLSS